MEVWAVPLKGLRTLFMGILQIPTMREVEEPTI
jgi:hypothetical protein